MGRTKNEIALEELNEIFELKVGQLTRLVLGNRIQERKILEFLNEKEMQQFTNPTVDAVYDAFKTLSEKTQNKIVAFHAERLGWDSYNILVKAIGIRTGIEKNGDPEINMTGISDRAKSTLEILPSSIGSWKNEELFIVLQEVGIFEFSKKLKFTANV